MPLNHHLKYNKTALLVSIAMLSNSMSYSYAASYTIPTDETLLSLLNAPQIKFTGVEPYLYRTAITPTPTTQDHIGSLYKYYWNNNIQALSPNFIPIYGANGITTFIPQVKSLFRVGDAFVDQGLVRAQISKALNRSFLPGYESHDEMITTLFKNGLDTASLHKLKFGARFNQTPSRDMIWPEYRIINGKNVLTPVVYLTESTMGSLLTGTNLSYGSMDINAANFTLDNVKVMGTRNAVITLTESFKNTSSLFVSASDINIMAAQNIDNLSGILSAKNINLTANAIKNETLVYVYNHQYGYNSNVANIAKITAVGDININSFTDFVNIGAELNAQGLLKINAQGNIIITSAKEAAHHLQSGDGWSMGSSHLNNIQSHLTAGEELSLIAGNAIRIEGASLESMGLVELLANNGIQILNDVNYTSSNYQFSFASSGLFGNKGSVQESKAQEELVRTLIKAGKDLRIRTRMGDITLRAVKVIADGVTEVINADGSINFPLAKARDYYSYLEQDKNLISSHNAGRGHNIEIAGYSEFLSKGGLFLDGRNGVYIEYEAPKDHKTLEEFALKLSEAPELAWMANLVNNGSADFQAVQLAYEQWDYEVNGLSPAAAAIVAIAVSLAMPAAGAGLQAALSSAAIKTIAIQASTSLLGNGFDVSTTLKELGSSQSVRALATSVATAGALYGLGEWAPLGYIQNLEASFGSFADWQSQLINSMYQTLASSGVNTVINGGDVSSFTQGVAQGMIANSVSYLGEKMANKIHLQSEAYRRNKTPENYALLMKTISHAALGCTMGMADKLNTHRPDLSREGACLSGAAGGVMGEYLGSSSTEEMAQELQADLEQYVKKYEGKTQLTAQEQQDIDTHATEFVKKWRARNADVIGLQSALIAATLGMDVNLTNQTAVNAAKNNAFFVPLLIAIAVQAGRYAVTLLTKRAIQAILAKGAYGTMVGNGNMIDGLNTISRCEDPICRALNEGKEAVINFAVESIKAQGGEAALAQFQNTMLALAQLPAPLTDAIEISFSYIEEKTGAKRFVTTTWAQLSQEQKEYLIAADTLLAGAIKIPSLNAQIISKINSDRVAGRLDVKDLPTTPTDVRWKELVQDSRLRYELTGRLDKDELLAILQAQQTMRLVMKDEKGIALGKGVRNDGHLGEKAGIDYLEHLTGTRYTPMQNASNNGADGFGFRTNPQGKIIGIDVVEVKSAIKGDTSAAIPKDNPRDRLIEWQKKANDGKFGPVTAETQQILDKLITLKLDDPNFVVTGIIVRIEVPQTAQNYLGVTLHRYPYN